MQGAGVRLHLDLASRPATVSSRLPAAVVLLILTPAAILLARAPLPVGAIRRGWFSNRAVAAAPHQARAACSVSTARFRARRSNSLAHRPPRDGIVISSKMKKGLAWRSAPDPSEPATPAELSR